MSYRIEMTTRFVYLHAMTKQELKLLEVKVEEQSSEKEKIPKKDCLKFFQKGKNNIEQ